MSTCKRIVLPTLLHLNTDPLAFRVVLRDIKDHDTFETREFDLPLNSTLPIGRASKNVAKHELTPAAHNAFIDSPVISREHAILSANTSSGTPQVYISDCASMHGTWLNGNKLQPSAPAELSHGDLLQFGVDVNRNDGMSTPRPSRVLPHHDNEADAIPTTEFYTARYYNFEAQLQHPFSLGFTVPDVDSEEEMLGSGERRGSQLHPLILDDSDSASEQSDDVQEVTIMEESDVKYIKSTTPASEPPAPTENGALADPDIYEYSAEEIAIYQTDSEDEEMQMTSGASDVASVGSLDDEYTSELEVPDSEDEEEIVEQHMEKNASESATQSPVDTAVASETNPLQASLPSLDHHAPFNWDNEVSTATELPALPSMSLFNHSFDSGSSGDNCALPLPPRASSSKSAPWHNAGFTAFGQQLDTQAWYTEDASGPPSYIGSNFGDRPALFSQAPPVATSEYLTPQAGDVLGSPFESVQQADRLQTPPMVPISDITTSPTPHPGRRTKVTIEEIVEEQPPTPTSISSLKRKADVLEIEKESISISPKLVTKESPAVNESILNDTTQSTPTVPVAVIAQRPKKQPKSIRNRMRDGATYTLLGVTGAFAAFAALSTLPDTFFT